MQQIADWLERLGMSEYAECFAENRIDFSVLPDLTDQDLEKLGVVLGDRRKMLRAISNLEAAEKSAPAIAAAATASAVPVGLHDTAERRQVTVMFSDLVGSTALSARMDPEDLREVILAYQKRVAETVQRFGGFLAKYMGDGVLIYFGYPQAHEDDADRAVRSGLELIAAVTALKSPVPLQTRVGIATGLVVVGDLIGSGEAQERGIVGETPNLAARLQSIAEPNMVVLAEDTRRLLGNLFELEDLGAKDLKGISGPVRAWAARRASSAEGRFEAMHATGLTALVGRDEEIDLLMRRWERAKQGEGSVVLISGEPGIGKSRIAQAVQGRLGTEHHTRLRYFCSPHHQDSALHPVISQLERAAGFRREDTNEQRLAKLETMLAQATNDLGDAVPLLAELLSLPTGERYPLLNLTPQKRKEKALKTLLAQGEGLAAKQPVLTVIEDAHWIDPTTREWLDLVVDRVSTLRVLVIVTFRPEFSPPWVGRPQVTLITLNRLPPRQRAQMISGVIGSKALPKEITDQIIERTDGIPLFIEELTKAVIESGIVAEAGDHYQVTGPLTPLAIPTSLHASLLARLDRLAPVREVAQIAAALGRQFSHELISAVSIMPKQQLDSAMDQLVSAELIFRRGTPPDAEYTFKHALVQDAAYSTLLKSRRQQIHARIVATLEGKFADIVTTQPALLAQHCTEAGLIEKAVGYWLRAGQQSVERSAMMEAVVQLDKGLELLKALPAANEVRQKQIRFLTTRAVALRIAKGYGSDELFATLLRARELCQTHGDPRQMFQILFGIWTATVGRADWLSGKRLAEECLAIAQNEADSAMLIEAHRLLGSTAVYMAEHHTAERHLRDALQIYEPEKHRANVLLYGYDPGTTCNGYISWALWLEGKIVEALAASAASRRLAIESEHAPSLALAYGWSAVLHLCTHDLKALGDVTSKLVGHCEEFGFPHWMALGKIGRGWFWARTGRVDDGLESLQVGIEEFRSLWGGFLVSAWLVCLADILRLKGRFTEARAALDDSLRMIERSNERIWKAENHRVCGEVARDAGEFSEAAAAFELAIHTAREQSARCLELRAATSLARLWRDQGKIAEARDLVAPVYNWFTERLDTPVLEEARKLLQSIP